jgi:Domain of unknown function (DUF4194)
MQEQQSTTPAGADLSTLAITLLKGVIYREGDERLWGALLTLQARVRDYMAVLGLELALDEAEGYAFLRSRPEIAEEESHARLPRLIARRPLSFPVSLLLALLRKKLAEFDASGADTRLVLSQDDIFELVRVFMPDSSNEARLIDQIETHINKVIELGFLRRMKVSSGSANFEVRRILKAFVDAQWLADFDARLAAYRTQLEGTAAQSAGGAESGATNVG